MAACTQGAAAGTGARSDEEVREVLVADEERDLADLAECILATQGFDVLIAYSAFDSLDLLEQHDDIDAVFADIVTTAAKSVSECAEAVPVR